MKQWYALYVSLYSYQNLYIATETLFQGGITIIGASIDNQRI